MSGNHQNSYRKMIRFVDKSIKFGADVIKFQVYKPDTITFNSKKKQFLVKSDSKKWSRYKSLYQLYDKAHTPWKWIEKIAKYLNSRKFPWFASVFDNTSVDFLQKLKCPAYKVASPEITDIGLIEKIMKTNKPIIASTAGATIDEIEKVVNFFKNRNKNFALMHCVAEYPTAKNKIIHYAKTRDA